MILVTNRKVCLLCDTGDQEERCLLCDTGGQEERCVCCVILVTNRKVLVIWWPRGKVCLLCDTGGQEERCVCCVILVTNRTVCLLCDMVAKRKGVFVV